MIAGSVRDFSDYREHLASAVRRREFLSSKVHMFVCFGDPITVAGTAPGRTRTYRRSLVTGLHDVSVGTEIGGPQH